MIHLPRAPVALAAALALAMAPAPAAAQPAPAAPPGKAARPPEDETTKLVDDAAKAAKAGKWEDARALLARAYQLKPSWKLAADLGHAEIGAQKFRDAAEHLALAARDRPESLDDAARKAIDDDLAAALAQIGVLKITAHPKGAEIFVGGKSVGTAPLPGPIFVDPGALVIEAKLDGYLGMRSSRTVAPGTTENVVLRLPRSGPVDVPPPPPTSTEGKFTNVSLPIVAGGGALAVVGLVTGTALAIVSDLKASQSHALEDPKATCGKDCASQFDALQKQKVTFAGASMWMFVLSGAAVVGTGIYVAVTIGKKSDPTAVRAGLLVRPDHVGPALTYSW